MKKILLLIWFFGILSIYPITTYAVTYKTYKTRVILPNGKVIFMNTKTRIGHIKVVSSPVFKNRGYEKLLMIEQKYGSVHKNIVEKDIKMFIKRKRKKYIKSSLKLIPIGNFNGFFKKNGIVKIVFSISGASAVNAQETFGNIYYIVRYLTYHHYKYKLAVVVWGSATGLLFNPHKNKKTTRIFRKEIFFSHKKGVKFYDCYNSLLFNHLVYHLLPKFVQPVPMGVLELYKLQRSGYIYVVNS